MRALFTVVQAVLPVVMVTGLGAGLRRLRWLTPTADASLLALTINLLTPCLILDKVLGSRALERGETVLLAPSIGFVVASLSIALSFAAAHLVGIRSEPTRRTFAFATGLQNYGYIPLPLALTLFGDETAAVLFVHNLGIELAIWTVGVSVVAGAWDRSVFRRVLSPPAIAIVVGLVLNALVGRAAIPSFLLHTLSLLGAAAIPLGLLLTGAAMADHARALVGSSHTRTVLLALGMRLGLLPLLYFFALFVVEGEPELARVLVLQAAMPAAMLPIVLSKHYGGDSLVALRVVFATTLGALITIPLWIHLGARWLGSP